MPAPITVFSKKKILTSLLLPSLAFALAVAQLGCDSTQTTGDAGPDAQTPPDARPADSNPGSQDAGPAPSPDAGMSADAQPDGSSDVGPGLDDPRPITERAGSPTHECRVARDRTDHTPRQWSGRQVMVTTTAGTAFLARYEGMSPDPMFPGYPGPAKLVVSTMAADGTLGASVTVSAADPDTFGGLAAAPSGDGFKLLWSEGSSLRLAGFSAQGTVSMAARTIDVPGIGLQSAPKVAAGADGGFGVVYAVRPQNQPAEVRFFAIDADGTVRRAPRRIGTSTSAFADPSTAIAASADGYALLWRGPAGMAGRIEFASTDLQGAERVAPRTITQPAPANVMIGGGAGFDPATTALLTVESGYLAAWVEMRMDPSSFSSGSWSIVRVARLDPSGVVQGVAAPLRAVADSMDEVEPSLTPFGDLVAVNWGRGEHIYICAGCVPDHRIDLLLIDPRTLTPRSNVVSVTNDGTFKAGGLLRRATVALGPSLLTTYNLTFHTYATPGSATFACQPRPVP
jgi:hypothetical protein